MGDAEKPGAGTGSGSRPETFTGTPTGTGTGTRPEAEAEGREADHGASLGGAAEPIFDHERLDVYRVAREFLRLVIGMPARRMPRDLRDQFERASSSILFNIGEGAGKTATAEKQRFYEIARGSTAEVATQLDVLVIRGLMTPAQYQHARALLIRVAQMLSRLAGAPRKT